MLTRVEGLELGEEDFGFGLGLENESMRQVESVFSGLLGYFLLVLTAHKIERIP